ncbi:MAG: hypothetical protein RI953_917 [Pseudomonadota bacterium]
MVGYFGLRSVLNLGLTGLVEVLPKSLLNEDIPKFSFCRVRKTRTTALLGEEIEGCNHFLLILRAG